MNVDLLEVGEVLPIGRVIESEISALKIELARLHGIGEHGGHTLYMAFFRA